MYAKLFIQMYDGTLATRGPWESLVTFQQLIILADHRGVVDMTVEAISRRTTIPIEILQKGLVNLMEPDPHSRTPTEDGRRIKLLSPSRPWGWQIVNYETYRQIRSADERREYHRQYYHDVRKTQQHSTVSTDSTESTQSTQSTQSTNNRGRGIFKSSKSKTLAASDSANRSLPKSNGARIEFDQVKGCFAGITEDQELQWQEAFPAVPIPPAIQRAAAWAQANPANRKSNWKRFLVNWFSREQDRAARVRK